MTDIAPFPLAPTPRPSARHTVTLILSGGIAAYKILWLIRRLREQGIAVRPVLTRAATAFVTPLSVASLAEHKAYTALWNLTDEAEMGHIRLARDSDAILIAPASADLLAKMAHGLADDLASTLLLAADWGATGPPILAAPAMNQAMWANPATQANVATLKARGLRLIGPADGDMACGETGTGRMTEPDVILAHLLDALAPKPLHGLSALVTAGPTQEPIDPVRYISNHSSGKQGLAIAQALARAGATTTLVHGPVQAPLPHGVTAIPVLTAQDMLDAAEAALPVHVAVATAAVADYRVAQAADQKLKKGTDGPPTLTLTENPDILATLARRSHHRPPLVIGFAAETEALIPHAQAKLARKGCDWILANLVGGQAVFGQDDTAVHLVHANGVEDWGTLPKTEVATRLVDRIAQTLNSPSPRPEVAS